MIFRLAISTLHNALTYVLPLVRGHARRRTGGGPKIQQFDMSLAKQGDHQLQATHKILGNIGS